MPHQVKLQAKIYAKVPLQPGSSDNSKNGNAYKRLKVAAFPR
jgi:hypothetical protein